MAKLLLRQDSMSENPELIFPSMESIHKARKKKEIAINLFVTELHQ